MYHTHSRATKISSINKFSNPSRKSYKTNNYLEKIRKYRRRISRLPIRHPAIEKRTRNRRGSVVIRGRLGKVRSPKWRAESNNRTRFVCKPPPNGQQEHTNHSLSPPPPPSLENRVQSLHPLSRMLDRDTAISANDSGNVHRIQISARFYLGLSVRRYGHKYKHKAGIRREGCVVWMCTCGYNWFI